MAKIVSVYGPPSSGKTTVSTVLAQCLADKGYNTCVVCCDKIVPTIPVLLPQSANKAYEIDSKVRSLGKILSDVEYSSGDILAQAYYTKKFTRIILLGYAYGENQFSYPTPTEYDVRSFLNKLSEMVEYIVVDCNSDLTETLTKVSIESSDSVIKLVGSTYKDVAYYTSSEKITPSGNVPPEAFLMVFPNVKPKDAIEDLYDFYGRVEFQINNNPEVEKMMRYGEYYMREFPKAYRDEIDRMIEIINFA